MSKTKDPSQLSKSERKELRQKYRNIAVKKDTAEAFYRKVTFRPPWLDSKWVTMRINRDLMNVVLVNDNEWRSLGFEENPSPRNLAIIDDQIPTSIYDYIIMVDAKKEEIDPIELTDSKLRGIIAGFAIYFGDVIIETVGGHWKFPTAILSYLGKYLHLNDLCFDRLFVVLDNGKKLPVFKIARWRLDGSGRIKSFYEVYEKIKNTGDWR